MMDTNNDEYDFPQGAIGVHTFWDLEGVSSKKLDDLELIENSMLEAAKSCGATTLGHRSHQFEPQGVTVLILLAESHLSFHSWPERGAAAVDLFSCSPSMKVKKVADLLREVFQPKKLNERRLVRGV